MLIFSILLIGVEYMRLLREKRVKGRPHRRAAYEEAPGPRKKRTAFFPGKANACNGNQQQSLTEPYSKKAEAI
ncbi:hypothetical protein FS935_02155 [Metabacillus litoralis]|uniref:Uncharacterized protein n=1 Tax=Metabacillus litoralis TaxID=152268 RepID=A0A5C6W986_9BACI|nr:hypothetical protein FS935_02155 [Metabacillus litoralis]